MEKLKKFLLEYLTIILYIISSILVEIIAACITDGKFYIRDPRYMLTIIAALSAVLLCIKNQKARVILISIFICVHGIINIIFMLLYDMAGQWFDWSMLLLRNDAMGILENVPVNFWYTIGIIFVTAAWLCFGLKYAEYETKNILEDNKTTTKNIKIVKYSTISIFIVLMLILNVCTGYAINGSTKTDPYDELLHSNTESKYQQYGATNNFVNEFYSNVAFYKEDKASVEDIENYLYSSVYSGEESGSIHGISSGNNVITILGETFEWMAFMGYEGTNFPIGSNIKLPNGVKLSNEKMRELYGNLYRLYDESYVLTNYHAREKTDISENYSILGNYPIKTYINYSYPNNVKPYTMPNILDLESEYKNNNNYSSQYFHDGYNSFYNRSQSIKGLGFDKQFYSEDMADASTEGIEKGVFTDYGSTTGDRNRDDEMIKACEKLMFPTNKRFYTYITTITTHGLYSRQRDNLKEEYKVLEDALGISIDNATTEELVYYTYMAAAMVTNKALGEIFSYLEQNNLLENTTIVLFGDHQGYYEGVSNYVKNISSTEQCLEDDIDYMDLYRVPCMIYDQKLVKEVTNNGSNPNQRFNTKFSSSCDIVPTLLDILGINYYEHMYYGHSVFTKKPTIIYSRGYGYWLDTYSYFLNINKFNWLNIKKLKEDNFSKTMEEYLDKEGVSYDKKSSYTDAELKELYIKYIDNVASKLVENIRYIDQMYKKDLYKNSTNYNKYIALMKKINNWSNSN